jgi:hypothetical protein
VKVKILPTALEDSARHIGYGSSMYVSLREP